MSVDEIVAASWNAVKNALGLAHEVLRKYRVATRWRAAGCPDRYPLSLNADDALTVLIAQRPGGVS
ncbi:hypothetical protein ACWDG9_17135 [Streptomyces sp. NPDC001073]